MSDVSKQRLYYLNNIDTIKARNKKYYHDNKAERQIYNRDYWDLHKHKYLKQRSEDIIYKRINDYIIKVIRKIKNMYTL